MISNVIEFIEKDTKNQIFFLKQSIFIINKYVIFCILITLIRRII